MATITQRELRNQSASIMDRVERGESFTVTRNGHPLAELRPIRGPQESISSDLLLKVMQDLPPMSHKKLRADADEFFQDGGDRLEY